MYVGFISLRIKHCTCIFRSVGRLQKSQLKFSAADVIQFLMVLLQGFNFCPRFLGEKIIYCLTEAMDTHSEPATANVASESGKGSSTNKELQKYWRPVKENPMDFTGWTYLLQYVEQEVS